MTFCLSAWCWSSEVRVGELLLLDIDRCRGSGAASSWRRFHQGAGLEPGRDRALLPPPGADHVTTTTWPPSSHDPPSADPSVAQSRRRHSLNEGQTLADTVHTNWLIQYSTYKHTYACHVSACVVTGTKIHTHTSTHTDTCALTGKLNQRHAHTCIRMHIHMYGHTYRRHTDTCICVNKHLLYSIHIYM